MAILTTLPGLEVSVLVDGNALHEYHDEDEVARLASLPERVKTVPVFIEAVSDKEFVVQISVNPSFDLKSPALVSHVVIDGKVVRKSSFSATIFPDSFSENKITTKVTRKIDGAFFAIENDNAGQLLKKFKFQRLVTSDTGPEDTDMKKAGEIVVHIFRAGASTVASPASGKPLGNGIKMSEARVHEKTLKGEAKSHTTSFGENQDYVEKNYHSLRLLDGRDKPIATFRFKYRSRDALKSLLIIRKSSPEPQGARISLYSRATPDLNDLDPEERRKVRDFLRAGNIKVVANINPSPRIKREPAIKKEGEVKTKSRENRFGGAVFVDLTDEVPAPAKRNIDYSRFHTRVEDASPSPPPAKRRRV